MINKDFFLFIHCSLYTLLYCTDPVDSWTREGVSRTHTQLTMQIERVHQGVLGWDLYITMIITNQYMRFQSWLSLS